MVVLKKMPSKAIIDGFKGAVDFYLMRRTPVARKWPVYHPREPHQAEGVNQQAFAYVNKIAKTLPTYIIDQYKRMAQNTPFTWKDLLVRAYMKGIDY